MNKQNTCLIRYATSILSILLGAGVSENVYASEEEVNTNRTMVMLPDGTDCVCYGGKLALPDGHDFSAIGKRSTTSFDGWACAKWLVLLCGGLGALVHFYSKRRKIERGDLMTFGNYPHDGDGGLQPIVWTVMKIFDGKALLLSREALDAQPMFKRPIGDDQSGQRTYLPNSPYEQSWLRQWLNSSFLRNAFTPQEKQLILETSGDTHHEEGLGKIFVLSTDDINDVEMFPSDLSTGCTATPYAKAQFDDIMERIRQEDEDRPYAERTSWWLRNGGLAVWGGTAHASGVVFACMDLSAPLAVRPALLVDVKAFEHAARKGVCKWTDDGKTSETILGDEDYSNAESYTVTMESERNGETVSKTEGHVFLIRKPTGDCGARMVFLPHHVNQQPQELTTMSDFPTDRMSEMIFLFGHACMGDADMQAELASHYWHGDGVPQNYAEAARWYRYAANQGNAAAMVDLAECYNKGLGGLAKDDGNAFALCKRAADAGFPLGMKNLASCYFEGIGTERNDDEGNRWLKRYEESQRDCVS